MLAGVAGEANNQQTSNQFFCTTSCKVTGVDKEWCSILYGKVGQYDNPREFIFKQ
jgi:hypothetical protein